MQIFNFPCLQDGIISNCYSVVMAPTTTTTSHLSSPPPSAAPEEKEKKKGGEEEKKEEKEGGEGETAVPAPWRRGHRRTVARGQLDFDELLREELILMGFLLFYGPLEE